MCGTEYGTCGSFLGNLWSPCASKVDDLSIASETASDLSVRMATQFQRFLISLCFFVANYGYSCQISMHLHKYVCPFFFWNENTGK